MASVLIIDDDQMICDVMARMMEKLGHESRVAFTGSAGADLAQSESFDVVFLDINLPDVNGLTLISDIRKAASSPEVIIITGHSESNGAEMAFNSGAWNYIEKPFRQQEISLQLSRVLQYRKEKGRVSTPGLLKRKGIIGKNYQVKTCLEKVSIAACSDVNVVITGEIGTGKKLFARTIHLNSARSDHPFVIVNCSSMTEATAGIMFRGYKTKSDSKDPSSRAGLIQKAHKGTLFLEEIGDLSLKIQRSLLQFLENYRFVPKGKNKTAECNFRLIASSCHDLEQLAEKGIFDSGLLAEIRLNHIHLPPLRSRDRDIISIALYYIQKFCHTHTLDNKGVTPEFLEMINLYSWPENIKELSNAMEKAVATSKNEPTLYSIHLPSYIKATVLTEAIQLCSGSPSGLSDPGSGRSEEPFLPLSVVLENTQINYLTRLMGFTRGNVQKASHISGVSRSRMYEKLKKYNLL